MARQLDNPPEDRVTGTLAHGLNPPVHGFIQHAREKRQKKLASKAPEVHNPELDSANLSQASFVSTNARGDAHVQNGKPSQEPSPKASVGQKGKKSKLKLKSGSIPISYLSDLLTRNLPSNLRLHSRNLHLTINIKKLTVNNNRQRVRSKHSTLVKDYGMVKECPFQRDMQSHRGFSDKLGYNNEDENESDGFASQVNWADKQRKKNGKGKMDSEEETDEESGYTSDYDSEIDEEIREEGVKEGRNEDFEDEDYSILEYTDAGIQSFNFSNERHRNENLSDTSTRDLTNESETFPATLSFSPKSKLAANGYYYPCPPQLSDCGGPETAFPIPVPRADFDTSTRMTLEAFHPRSEAPGPQRQNQPIERANLANYASSPSDSPYKGIMCELQHMKIFGCDEVDIQESQGNTDWGIY